MAKLRTLADRATPDPKLAARGVDVWLTPGMVESMGALWAASKGSDLARRGVAAREAWRLYSGSWGFTGTLDELLTVWAEERRQVACKVWVSAAPGRSMAEFAPFGSDRHDLI